MNAVLASPFSVHRSSFRLSSYLRLQAIGSFIAEVLSVDCDEVTQEEVEPWVDNGADAAGDVPL